MLRGRRRMSVISGNEKPMSILQMSCQSSQVSKEFSYSASKDLRRVRETRKGAALHCISGILIYTHTCISLQMVQASIDWSLIMTDLVQIGYTILVKLIRASRPPWSTAGIIHLWLLWLLALAMATLPVSVSLTSWFTCYVCLIFCFWSS